MFGRAASGGSSWRGKHVATVYDGMIDEVRFIPPLVYDHFLLSQINEYVSSPLFSTM